MSKPLAQNLPQEVSAVNISQQAPPAVDRLGSGSQSPRGLQELADIQSEAAEEAICSQIQLNESILDFRELGLAASDFRGGRRFLVESYLRLDEAGCPITFPALVTDLQREGKLEAIGGRTYLGKLVDGVPREGSLEPHAGIVIGQSVERELWRTYSGALSLLSGGTGTHVRERVDARVSEICARLESGPGLIINADDRHHIRPAQSLIDGVLDLNQISTLYGPAGDGKSHVALDMALSVAQVGPAIFVGAEAVEDLPPRIDAWKARHNVPLTNLWIFPEPIRLADPPSIYRFISTAVKLSPLLICIDPLASCLPGLDENSTDAMTRAVDSLNMIRRATGASLLVVHHSGWNTDHERGSSVLRAASRIVTSVTKLDEVIRVTTVKRNSGRFAVEKFFKVGEVSPDDIPNYDPNQSGRYTILMPAARIASEFGPLTPKQQATLECLALANHRDGARFMDVVGHLGAHKGSVNYLLSALIRRGLVINDKGIYTLTETGHDVANSVGSEPQVQPNSTTELALNWYTNESLRSSDIGSVINPVVQSSSVPVQSQFSDPSPVQFSQPPLKGAELLNSELNSGWSSDPEQEQKPDPIYISEPAEDWAEDWGEEYDPAAALQEED